MDFSYRRDHAIIKFVPSILILYACTVVSTPQVSKMVHNCIKFITLILLTIENKNNFRIKIFKKQV